MIRKIYPSSILSGFVALTLMLVLTMATPGITSAQSMPSVLVNPSAAPAGTTVTFTGTGFIPGEWIEVDFGGMTIATAQAVGGSFQVQGTLTLGVPVDFHPMDFNGDMGSWVGIDYEILPTPAPSPTPAPTATSTPTPSPSPVAYVPPTVAVIPTEAMAGEDITISGMDFLPGENVTIQFAGWTLGVLTANNGILKGLVTLPNSVPAGSHPMDFDGDMGSQVTISYKILPPPTPVATPTPAPVVYTAPSVAVDPLEALSGADITVAGMDFLSGEKVTIEFAGATLGVVTASGGSFKDLVTLPKSVPAGGHPMDFNGDMGSQVTISYKILPPPAPIVYLTPYVTVDPTEAMSGEDVTVTGKNFIFGEIVSIDFAGATLANVTATNGQFQVVLTLPNGVPAGSHPMDINGNMGSQVTLSYKILPTPAPAATPAPVVSTPMPSAAATPGVTIDPTEAMSGADITVTGVDFILGENVTIEFAGATLGNVTAVNGSFQKTVTLPVGVPADSHPMDFNGDMGSQVTLSYKILPAPVVVPVSTPAPVISTPVPVVSQPVVVAKKVVKSNAAIVANPAEARPGQQIELKGSGFQTGERVTFRMLRQDLTTVKAVDGTFFAKITIPTDAAEKRHTIKATGDLGSETKIWYTVLAPIQPAVVAVPSLVLDPPQATPDTAKVELKGSGFASGEVVTVTLAGQELGEVVAEQGEFQVTIRFLDTIGGGNYPITAVGDQGSKANVSLEIIAPAVPVSTPAIQIAPAEALPGEKVVVTGSGFQTGEVIEVSLGGEVIFRTLAADGVFLGEAVLPGDVDQGVHEVVGAGDMGTRVVVSITVLAPSAPILISSIDVVPSEAAIGESVQVSGTGFYPGEVVEIAVGGVVVARTAAIDGTIQVKVDLPETVSAGFNDISAAGDMGSRTASVISIVEVLVIPAVLEWQLESPILKDPLAELGVRPQPVSKTAVDTTERVMPAVALSAVEAIRPDRSTVNRSSETAEINVDDGLPAMPATEIMEDNPVSQVSDGPLQLNMAAITAVIVTAIVLAAAAGAGAYFRYFARRPRNVALAAGA